MILRNSLCLVTLLLLFAGDFSYAQSSSIPKGSVVRREGKKVIVVQENQDISFDGMSIEGELKAPGEFYFQNRPEEKFDSLTKRRPNFRREMMRDAVVSQ